MNVPGSPQGKWQAAPQQASAAPAATDTMDPMTTTAAAPAAPASAVRPSAAFMCWHPAHLLALGLGSGLSPKAPGTVGTLWAWLSFLLLDRYFSDRAWAGLLLAALLVGLWACTLTAQHLRTADPGAIVWDEVLAFWLVLWLVGGGFWTQLLAFALFRYFDAAKPGPVGWADRLYKLKPGEAISWRQGWGILFDDLVAAGCTLLVMATLTRLWN